MEILVGIIILVGFLVLAYFVGVLLARDSGDSEYFSVDEATLQYEAVCRFAKDAQRAFATGGTAYAMYVEQQYKTVKLPQDRDGYTNHTFAAMMNWFVIPIAAASHKHSKYNISRNLYALLDFNIAMYVVFDNYLFGEGDPFNLRQSWKTLYYNFLSQYCHKNFYFKDEDMSKFFNNRLEYYRYYNEATIDDIDTSLVEFIIRDMSNSPFATTTPVIDFEEKAKLFDTVSESLKVADEISRKILDNANQV
jgi:hypothetical protein